MRTPLHAHGPNVDRLFNEAVILARSGRFKAAEDLYRQCLKQQGETPELLYNLGLALQRQGRRAEAISQYRRVLALRPDYANAYANMGAAYQEAGSVEDALYAIRQAISIVPCHAQAHCILAALLLETGALEQASDASRTAIKLAPNLAPAWFNLGASYNAQNRLDEAAEAFIRAIRLDPMFAAAHFCLSHIRLLQGHFEQGWTEFEWRWQMPEYAVLRQDYGCPVWDGSNLKGRTLLIHGEVGLGDAILFARFVPIAAQKGGQVILSVDDRLTDLFACFEDVRVIAHDTSSLPPFDLHCPLLSLPRALGSTLDTLPRTIPYLRSRNKMSHKRTDGEPLRVGVVWAGNPKQRADTIRSPRLPAIEPIFSVPGINFVSLQVGGEDAHPLPPHVIDAGANLWSMMDTAGIMQTLDLVISSCTAPLHLAAALGIPAWGLIPFAPYFPWMFHVPENPWYPAIRLYRQKQRGTDWSAVVREVIADLENLKDCPRSESRTHHLVRPAS
jgi:Flp pilus assembly protein TadD